MAFRVRPITANLTHDTELFERMDPYVKIYFGGQQFRTRVCSEGGKHPSWNETFTFNSATDSNMRIEVWDSDLVNDDLVGEGSFNLMKIYDMPGTKSANEYIDLFYKGRGAGRILISFEMMGMNGYGQQNFGNQNYNQMPINNGWTQPPINSGWNQPPINNGWNQPPIMSNPINNGWGQPPLMNNPLNNNNGWGQTSLMSNPFNNNNGWNLPPNNGWSNNGWGL